MEILFYILYFIILTILFVINYNVGYKTGYKKGYSYGYTKGPIQGYQNGRIFTDKDCENMLKNIERLEEIPETKINKKGDYKIWKLKEQNIMICLNLKRKIEKSITIKY